ncbi:hypothetical protein K1T71_009770 [Dendrolimus kikuchii]|uniref:Uncharacterized protein n=1 Tax=Dendrolimus kikuchii TaxID=765133 RepID=A0ACC1CSS3_9NEOP|nr:hypothetical protein K1T71_009770 [Dendrolimus kikuchii]
MSPEDQLTVEQLEDKIETEYLTAIQLIHTISTEFQLLKHATSPGGEFEANVLENAELMSKLIEMGQLNLSDLKPRTTGINLNTNRQGSSAEQELGDSQNIPN